MELNDRRFAVLIDADNVSPKYIKYILNEVSDLGGGYLQEDLRRLDRYRKEKLEKCTHYDWSVNPIQQYAILPEKILRLCHDH